MTQEMRKIAEKNGISASTLSNRLSRGWTEEKAVTEPVNPRKITIEYRKRREVEKVKKNTKESIEKLTESIIRFSREIGLSYGEVKAYLNMGLSEQEITEKYGKSYSREPHRWAKEDIMARKTEEMKIEKEEIKEMKESQKAVEQKKEPDVYLLDSKNIYQSKNRAFKLSVSKNTMTISKGSYQHLKITAEEAKELTKALAEICAK